MKGYMKPPKSIIPMDSADEQRPETDYEHSQRYLNDIDRSTWRGVHAPARGQRGTVHKIAVASNVPQIYKQGG